LQYDDSFIGNDFLYLHRVLPLTHRMNRWAFK
jgi:hypothetical protein